MANWKLVIGNKNYSSWSMRPWLVLKHAGVAFEEIRVLLHQPNTTAEISRYSPSGRVPALITEELTVWESLAICEFLAERFPDKRLWPAEAKMRAHARSVANEMHAGFGSLRQNCPMDIRSRYSGRHLPPEVTADAKRIQAIWAECRQRYAEHGDLLFGEFSIADAMYAPVVTRFLSYDVPVSEAARRYMDAVLALPAMQEWVAAAKAEPEVIVY